MLGNWQRSHSAVASGVIMPRSPAINRSVPNAPAADMRDSPSPSCTVDLLQDRKSLARGLRHGLELQYHRHPEALARAIRARVASESAGERREISSCVGFDFP